MFMWESMKQKWIDRRTVLASWIATALVTSWTTGAASDILSYSDLNRRIIALSQCTWQGFQNDMIHINASHIKIGSVVLEFYDTKSLVTWKDYVWKLTQVDVQEILELIAWNSAQQVFFLREIVWMNWDEYWLSDSSSSFDYDDQAGMSDKQSCLKITDAWIILWKMGDGYWDPNTTELSARNKV